MSAMLRVCWTSAKMCVSVVFVPSPLAFCRRLHLKLRDPSAIVVGPTADAVDRPLQANYGAIKCGITNSCGAHGGSLVSFLVHPPHRQRYGLHETHYPQNRRGPWDPHSSCGADRAGRRNTCEATLARWPGRAGGGACSDDARGPPRWHK